MESRVSQRADSAPVGAESEAAIGSGSARAGVGEAFLYVAEYQQGAMRLRDASPESSRLAGIPPEHLSSRIDWFSVLLPEDAPILRQGLESLDREPRFRVEYRIRRPDGEIRLVRQTARRVPAEGDFTALYGEIIDITPRQIPSPTSAESYTALREALASAPMMLYEQDLARGIVRRTGDIAELLGFAAGEVGDAGWWESRIHPDDLPRLKAFLINDLTEAQYRFEYRVRHREGHYVAVQDTGWRVQDPGGNWRLTGCTRGVDHARLEASCAAEEAKDPAEVLRSSEERFRIVAEACPLGIFLASTAGKTVYINPSARHILGVAGEEDGMSWRQRIHRDDRRRVDAMWEMAVQAREPVEVDCRFINFDGETRYCAVAIKPVVDPAGGFRGYVGSVTDVTHRVTADRERRESEARFRLAVEAADLGTWEWDFQTGFVEASALAREHCNWPRIEPIPYDTCLRLNEPEIRPDVQAALRDAIAEGAVFRSRQRVADSVAGDRWVHMLGRVMRDESGFPRRLVGITADVTEQVETEERIRALNASLEARVEERTAALKAANQEMETFCYTVSHDLRAPLRAMLASSVMLVEDYADDLTPEARTRLERIGLSARKMGSLIDDLLSFARLSRRKLDREEIDFSALATDLAEELGSENDDCEIQVEPEMRVFGDVSLLRSVLQNLMENAIKFQAEGRRLQIEIGTEMRGEERVFCLRDNGIGLEMQHAERIFMPFERLHTEDHYPGTGIGLASVRRIIERHQGQIWVESTPEVGTTFYFTLPDPD